MGPQGKVSLEASLESHARQLHLQGPDISVVGHAEALGSRFVFRVAEERERERERERETERERKREGERGREREREREREGGEGWGGGRWGHEDREGGRGGGGRRKMGSWADGEMGRERERGGGWMLEEGSQSHPLPRMLKTNPNTCFKRKATPKDKVLHRESSEQSFQTSLPAPAAAGNPELTLRVQLPNNHIPTHNMY